MVPKEATKEAFPADFDQGDPGEGRAEGESETKEDHMLQALRLGVAEEHDDAQGQDEGFKEDDQEGREGARKGGLAREGGLTREWLDMLFYDSEEDGDEGFDEDGFDQQQPGLEYG